MNQQICEDPHKSNSVCSVFIHMFCILIILSSYPNAFLLSTVLLPNELQRCLSFRSFLLGTFVREATLTINIVSTINLVKFPNVHKKCIWISNWKRCTYQMTDHAVRTRDHWFSVCFWDDLRRSIRPFALIFKVFPRQSLNVCPSVTLLCKNSNHQSGPYLSGISELPSIESSKFVSIVKCLWRPNYYQRRPNISRNGFNDDTLLYNESCAVRHCGCMPLDQWIIVSFEIFLEKISRDCVEQFT